MSANKILCKMQTYADGLFTNQAALEIFSCGTLISNSVYKDSIFGANKIFRN